jgi:hypothetical protein
MRKIYLKVKRSAELSANGLGICDDAVIAIHQLNFVLKFNSSSKAEHIMSSRIIANTLLAVRLSCFLI